MNLPALAIHLLFFPFGNDGYTSRSWDGIIGFGDCPQGCNEREAGYTCDNSEHDFMHCSCWDCQRDCQLSEAKVNIDYCNAAASHVAQVGVDVDAHLASLTADLAIGLAEGIPVVGATASPLLSFGKGLFEMYDDDSESSSLVSSLQSASGSESDESDDSWKDQNAWCKWVYFNTRRDGSYYLLNSVIDDVNARLDTMNKCMGQMITKVQVDGQIDSIQRAFTLYGDARFHQCNINDDQMDKLKEAWSEHVLVAHSEFDNVAKSADYFGQLLLPMQDFAQSFVLVSFDYLIHVHELDWANYEDAYEKTIEAFEQLRTWADKARDVIKLSISNTMHTLPCKNGQAIENEKNIWNANFLSTNVYPIDSYMDRLAELNNVFTEDLFSWLGCYGDTGRRAMVHVKNGASTIECYDLCMENGYSLFGVQITGVAGQCFCSNDKDDATRYGVSASCNGRGRGVVWGIGIYQMNDGHNDCANGYYSQSGDVRGWGKVDGVGGGQQVPNCNECAELCSDHDNCLSYECSETELKCNLNSDANPTAGAWKDYAFCTKNGDIRLVQ